MHCLQQEFSTLLSSFALATIVFEQKSTGQYELEAFSSTSLQILGFLNRPTTDEMLDRLALNNLSDSLFPLTYMLPATEGRSVASQGMVCRSEDEHFLLVLLCKAEEVKTQYDMLFTLDDQFTVEKVEGLSLVQHLRLPLSEVVGMQFSSFFDAQTAGDLHRLLERAKSTHSKQSIFYQSPLSGDVRYLKATASYDQQKGCFLVGVDNISAQLGLVLQHETTEAEGLLIAEDDEQRSEVCRIVYADANAETLLEQSKTQLLGTPLDGLFASESLTDSSLIRYVSPGGNQKQLRLVTEQFSDYRLLRISQWGRASKKVGWINLLLQLSFELLQASSEVIEPTMQSILERLGQFSASDRVYIFECSSDCTSVSNTYEWCAPEVGSQKASLQQNDCSLFPRWMETLMHGQEIYIVQVQNLPDSWEAERAILLDQQIQSVLVEPIMASKQLFGFIGFDSVHSPKDWPQEVRELLLYFANILGAFFSRTSTEQQLAQALKTTTDLAATREQQNRSLSAFYAKMSHDIRNALYAITGSSEQLLQTLLAPQAQSAASMIHSNAVFVSHLIQDLLDFSTVSDQPLLLRSEPFSFPDVFSRSVAAVTLLASEKQLTINTIHDDTIPTTLLGDEVRLSQILINLLHNAIKFTDEGSITLQAKLVHQSCEQATISLCVDDTGRGFDDERHAQSGHGLGLMIVRQLLSAMGSTLSIERKVQAGTTICSTITFNRPAKTSNKRIEKDLSILVVDDSAMNRQLLKELLHDLGYTSVAVAERGEDAITLLTSNAYQLAFLDLTMPSLDGIETARQLRALCPELVIVIITAYLSTEQEREAREVGIRHVLLKPIAKQVLSNLLEQMQS